MANKTITDLTEGAAPDGTELLHGVQGGNSRKFTLANLLAWWLTDDDTMAAAVATKPASGESVKAYIDGKTTPWVAYTPTFTGFGTVSSVSFFSRRVGDSLEIHGTFASGTSTASEARITLGFDGVDGGITSAGSTKLPGRVIAGVGAAAFATAGLYTTLAEPGRGYLMIGLQTASTAGYQPANGNALISSGNAMTLRALIPIDGW